MNASHQKVIFFLVLVLSVGCSSLTLNRRQMSDQARVRRIFHKHPGNVITLEARDPGRWYHYETSEKDKSFGKYRATFRFRTVRLKLRKKMPPGTILADLEFHDNRGTKVSVKAVNLLKLIPQTDSYGKMQYVEWLLEEYGRFGLSFRKEHNEFQMKVAKAAPKSARESAKKVYRLGVWNNCLDPRKWEMVLSTESFDDFSQRSASSLSLGQKRTLAHSWFYMDDALYRTLVKIKNPHLRVNPSMPYEALSDKAESVRINFKRLSPVTQKLRTRTLEVGHHSGRKLVPVEGEQFYKWQHGLFLNRKEFRTYFDVTKEPVKLGQFSGMGFYQIKDPKKFDYWWLRRVNNVRVEQVANENSKTYIKITLSGKNAPFKFTIGNIDLALLDEQKFLGIPFGINAYPKTRRYNPAPDTIRYDSETMPKEILPYTFLTSRKDNRFINNHKKGVEKILLTWDSIERDTLVIYVLSYERIMPVWMARVKLSREVVDLAQLKRRLYIY